MPLAHLRPSSRLWLMAPHFLELRKTAKVRRDSNLRLVPRASLLHPSGRSKSWRRCPAPGAGRKSWVLWSLNPSPGTAADSRRRPGLPGAPGRGRGRDAPSRPAGVRGPRWRGGDSCGPLSPAPLPGRGPAAVGWLRCAVSLSGSFY